MSIKVTIILVLLLVMVWVGTLFENGTFKPPDFSSKSPQNKILKMKPEPEKKEYDFSLERIIKNYEMYKNAISYYDNYADYCYLIGFIRGYNKNEKPLLYLAYKNMDNISNRMRSNAQHLWDRDLHPATASNFRTIKKFFKKYFNK